MTQRLTIAGLAIATILISIPMSAQVPAVSNGRLAAGQISLEVLGGVSGQERRLAITKGDKELGSIVMPPRVPAESIAEGLKGVLVHPNGQDLAVGFKGESRSYVRRQNSSFVVFLRQASGAYLAMDVSGVEHPNIGKSGPFRAYFDLETVPIEWLPRDKDSSVQIRLQTRARDQSGQPYRPTEPLIITRDGRPLWR